MLCVNEVNAIFVWMLTDIARTVWSVHLCVTSVQFVCRSVGCSTSQQHMLLCLMDASAQAIVCSHSDVQVTDETASPCRSVLTPGQPVLPLTL